MPGIRLVADYHTHTRYSHGSGTVEDNILAARRRGLKAVAITDHGPAMVFGLGVKGAGTLLRIKEDVNRYNQVYPDIRTYAGVEANVIGVDGTLDVPRRVLKELDLVLAGLHLQVRPKTLADGFHLIAGNIILARTSRRLKQRVRVVNTKALVEAVNRYDINIITHPGLHLDIDTAELARACARRGTSMEINAGHGYMTEEYVRIAEHHGATFAIDSDAHRPENVGRLERGLAVAEKVGLNPERIINAAPAGKRERPSKYPESRSWLPGHGGRDWMEEYERP